MGRERTPEEILARKAKKEAGKALKKSKLAPEPKLSNAEETSTSTDLVPQDHGGLKRHRPSLQERLNPKRECFDAELKKKWSKMSTQEKKAFVDADKDKQASVKRKVPRLQDEMPFVADPDDHCETPPSAYRDIVPFLDLVAQSLGRTKANLRIYDPYYCSGAMKRHLNALGFEAVHNRCEDFYSVIEKGAIPEHDVVVTNPPYSEDPEGGANHVAKLLRFLKQNKKPYLLNMPEYVTSAAYFKKHFQKRVSPLLFCPRKRYHFWSPEGARSGQNAQAHRNPELGVRSSPFVALWYISLRPHMTHDELMELTRAGDVAGICAGAESINSTALGCLVEDVAKLPEGRHLFKALA